ncbi:MAG: Cys-tRNA(Pro) deacylase, partial [Mesorhizobium sp.]
MRKMVLFFRQTSGVCYWHDLSVVRRIAMT